MGDFRLADPPEIDKYGFSPSSLGGTNGNLAPCCVTSQRRPPIKNIAKERSKMAHHAVKTPARQDQKIFRKLPQIPHETSSGPQWALNSELWTRSFRRKAGPHLRRLHKELMRARLSSRESRTAKKLPKLTMTSRPTHRDMPR